MTQWFTTLLENVSWQLLFFWMYAIFALNLYRGWKSGKLTWKMPAWWLAIAGMLGFLVLDWVMNRTIFAVLCWQSALNWTELVTTRCSRYRTCPGQTNGWQRFVANTTCGLLNAFNFDNTDHC